MTTTMNANDPIRIMWDLLSEHADISARARAMTEIGAYRNPPIERATTSSTLDVLEMMKME